jgi:hypothetical protein
LTYRDEHVKVCTGMMAIHPVPRVIATASAFTDNT